MWSASFVSRQGAKAGRGDVAGLWGGLDGSRSERLSQAAAGVGGDSTSGRRGERGQERARLPGTAPRVKVNILEAPRQT